MPKSELQIDVAFRAFWADLNRSWLKHCPNRPFPAPPLEELDSRTKAVFRRAIERALNAADLQNIEKMTKRNQGYTE